MNELSGFPSSYRRLLWTYPRWYRRERGVEILTTLLDAAPPGKPGPGPRDALNLAVGGCAAGWSCRRAVSGGSPRC